MNFQKMFTRKSNLIGTLLMSALFIIPSTSNAQFFKRKKKKVENTEASKKKSNRKSIDEVTKQAEAFEGLFTLYRDTVTGESWMEIQESALGSEFIYFSQVEDGVLQTGNYRGAYQGSKIISFRKNYERIEILGENTSYYFDPESPLSKAESANINLSLIHI